MWRTILVFAVILNCVASDVSITHQYHPFRHHHQLTASPTRVTKVLSRWKLYPKCCYNCNWCQFKNGLSNKISTCNCSRSGSVSRECAANGRCKCKNLFAGMRCDKCIVGYYKTLRNGSEGCEDCRCTQSGSVHSVCQTESGQCECKEGHEGLRCEKCKEHWYRPDQNNNKSCEKCEECKKPGHICDKSTGKCVCPPNSQGDDCSVCAENAWGYEPGLGCKLCGNCSKNGSVFVSGRLCNETTGECSCKPGFTGTLCSLCAKEHYGYDCSPCDCDKDGTVHGSNDCNKTTGDCKCKTNSKGRACDECKDGTFPLNSETSLSERCTECFCFKRQESGKNYCEKAAPNELKKYERISYDDSIVTTTCEKGNHCWKFPLKLPVDLVHFYDGFLTLHDGNKDKPEYRVFITSKIMVHREDFRKEFENVEISTIFNKNNVRLVEKDWQFDLIPSNMREFCKAKNNSPVPSRKCFLIILHNVESVTVLFNEPRSRLQMKFISAKGTTNVEKCQCPEGYTGLSCQKPNRGYYRSFENTTNPLEKMVGVAVKCNCNGKSEDCNPLTGHCENCQGDSDGEHCEICKKGFYLGNGKCSECKCHRKEERCEFDDSVIGSNHRCICREGYDDATRCKNCANGYYKRNGTCISCDCDKDGTAEDTCDHQGKCTCKEGFTGEKCDQCSTPRFYFDGKKCTACENDKCVRLLFEEIDYMEGEVTQASELFSNTLNAPWRKFSEYMNMNTELRSIFQDKLQEVDILLNDSRISDYSGEVHALKKRLNEKAKPKDNFLKQTEDLKEKTDELLKEVLEVRKNLDESIKEIDETGRTHLDNAKALTDATKSLKHMDNIEKFFNRNYNKHHSARCKTVEMKILDIYNSTTDIDAVRKMLNNLNMPLDSITSILENIQNNVAELEAKNIKNSERIESLKKNITSITEMNEDISKAEEYLDIIKKYGAKMSNLSSALDTIDFGPVDKLEAVVVEGNNLEKLDQLFLLVIEHVEGLEGYVNGLNRTFSNESIAKNPAANYVNIVKKVNETRNILLLTNETITTLNNRIEKGSTENDSSESLAAKALLLHAKSDRLLKRASNIKKNARLGLVDTNIDNSKDKLYEYGRSNNKLLQKIQMMKNGAVDWAAILKNLSGIDEIRRIQNELNTLNLTSQYDLHKHIVKYKQIFSEEERGKFHHENEDLIEKLKDIKRTVNNGVKLIQKQDESFNNSRINSISNKIKELKNSILYARQAANEVNVAMELNKCSRKYRVPNSLDVWRSVKVKFKCTNCLLFKALSRNKTVTLTVSNGKVHFNLNEREILSLKLRENAEETVSVEFLVPVVTLILSENVMRESTIVEDAFYMPSTIEVGSTESIQNGYISSLQMNNEKIGLWNFVDTDGTCDGTASEETSLEKGESYYFLKDAYKKYEKSNLNVKEIGMTFTFATFDENSVIYLAQDTNNLSSFIALRLDDGHIKLHVRHIDGTEIVLGTENRYNDGETNVAVIGMQYNGSTEKYNLTINNEHKFTERPLKSKNVFKIRKSHQYIGGVNPIFDKSNMPFDIPYSFQGFLKHSTGPTNLIMENGVAQYHDLQYTKAWFGGNDCLTLSTIKRPIKSVRFTFRPLNSSSFLANITNFGFISLNNDHAEFKYGQNTFIMNNLIKLNDYNYININKTHFIANEEAIEVGKLNFNHIESMHFGCNDNYPYYNGGISDIFVDNMQIYLNKSTVQECRRVEIGRERPFSSQAELKMLTSPETTNSMQNTEGCAPISHYTTDERAVKFGDKPNSYVYINSPFWKRDFKFKFHFRTFYPDGLLIISAAPSRTHFNFLQLQKGKIQLYVKGRKKKTLFNDAVNDGMWHTVSISTVVSNVNRKKRKLVVGLDENPKKVVNIPRNTIKGEIYLGGVSEDFTNYIELKNNLLPFRGCMKSVEINDLEQEIVKNSNIGQCFPNVEEGAYFSGDAYAIYKSNFQVNNILELGFQFRTAEQNGILLSVSNNKNSPALSVELQNGAVVMTVDMGNGIISKVTNNLDSEFALCNNKWHNVTALYSNSELTVNIDGITKTWVQSDVNSLMDEIDAPLYIGGLPDNAPIGTLKTRENFKGCIRNMNIEGILMDWTDMENLNNILLNSCPIT